MNDAAWLPSLGRRPWYVVGGGLGGAGESAGPSAPARVTYDHNLLHLQAAIWTR